ncbi:hypothetical protein B9479_007438 [Cryptococcus floricola]|uniref:Uncharacterized protein n=1 Tax=Cryptococcus floricola TaxID=2591691 RepID=A0A5D3AMG7_9TREE|nr:hypothetical protein B9479_007438 [Cryptococcus floricola]
MKKEQHQWLVQVREGVQCITRYRHLKTFIPKSTLQNWRFINQTPDLTDDQALLDMLDRCDYLHDLIHKTCQRFPSIAASETEVRNALNQVDSLLKANPCPYFGHGVEKWTTPTIVVRDHPPAFALALTVYFQLARNLRLLMAPISVRLEDGMSVLIAYSGNSIDCDLIAYTGNPLYYLEEEPQ